MPRWHLCAPLRRRTVPPPPLAHVCGAAAAFRQDNYTALHCAVIQCRASCVESLLKAGADASLKTNVSDGHEGSGRGGVGLRGGRRGPAQAPHRFSAPPSSCPLSPLRRPPPPPSALSRRRMASDARRRWTSPSARTARLMNFSSRTSWRTPLRLARPWSWWRALSSRLQPLRRAIRQSPRWLAELSASTAPPLHFTSLKSRTPLFGGRPRALSKN